MKECEELSLLEELVASEELYTPYQWFETSNGMGKLNKLAEKVAVRHLKYRRDQDDNLLFEHGDVKSLFRGWGMSIF